MKLIFYFRIVCKELDDEFLKMAKTYDFKAGTTLLLSIIHNGRFTIANIGDSAAREPPLALPPGTSFVPSNTCEIRQFIGVSNAHALPPPCEYGL